MRQNTVPVIESQVRAQTPPDHAGVAYNDGDASARASSCWAEFYDGARIESRGRRMIVTFPNQEINDVHEEIYGYLLNL